MKTAIRVMCLALAAAGQGALYASESSAVARRTAPVNGIFDKLQAPAFPRTFSYRTDFPVQSSYPNIDVNAPGNSVIQGETGIAIDPLNPNVIICGSNDYRSAHTQPNQWAYISSDGGNTWVEKALPAGSALYNDVSDPSLAFDANGVAYYGFGQFSTAAGGPSAVTVQTSVNGGQTWNSPVEVYTSSAGTFEDKYYVAADASPTSLYKNNAYISWTHFINNNSGEQVFVARSTNEGASWLAPAKLSDYGHLSMPAIGPNGEVYVFWSAVGYPVTNLVCAVSLDGGANYGAPILVQSVNTLPAILTNKDNLRMITYVSAAVDRSPAHTGRVYVAYAALDAGGKPHVFLMYSDTKGGTWSTPMVIDGDMTTGTDKFFPWISCDPVSGAVAVGFYDSRNDPVNNALVDLYLAYSTNGAQSFSVVRITSTNFGITTMGASPAQGKGGYWADYTGISAYKGVIMPCWTDQRSGSSIYNTDIYVSIVKLGPASVTNLAASVQPLNPSSIALSWKDPTAMLTGAPLTSFSVLIYRDSQYVGSVAKGTQTFTDNGLTTGTYHTYQVYVATATDTSDAASAGAYAGGALQPDPPVLLSTREYSNGTIIQWQNPATHVDNTPLYDLNEAYIYIDGALADSVQLGAADTNAVKTLSIDYNFIRALTIRRFHTFSVAVGASRAGIYTKSVGTDTVMWYAGPPNTALDEGFEESGPIFGATGTWAVTTAGAHTGSRALVDNTVGKSPPNEDTYVMFPPTVIQPLQTQLSFWQVALIAANGSGTAEFTIDHGKTWITIGSYKYSDTSAYGSSVASSSWVNKTYDLSKYVGDTVVVRFRLHTGGISAIQKPGWYVDDIALQQSNAVVEPPAPAANALMTGFPNPFSDETMITVANITAIGAPASLRIYNALGIEVADLSSALRGGRRCAARFNARMLPAGVYFAEFRSGAVALRRQLALVK